MKTIIKLTLLLLAFMLPTFATAHDFEVDGIYYICFDDQASVTWKGTSYDSYYSEYSGDVIIPATVTYNGTTYPVVDINHYAFYCCTELTSVEIPNSVTHIGRYSFYGCRNLTNVNIGNSINSIGSCAFFDCNSLTNITCLAKTPPTIENNTFNSYSAELTVPRTALKTYQNTEYWKKFTNIRGIYDFEINGIYYNIISETDNTVEVTYKDTSYKSYNGIVNIPSKVTYNGTTYDVISIGEYAFCSCSNLISVSIPGSVKIIGCGAFYGCIGLTSITIPNSVTSIGEQAFYNCTSLIELYYNAVSCADFYTHYSDSYSPFTDTFIANIIIGESVKRIPANFVKGLTTLRTTTIGNSVSTIGNSAFYGCNCMTKITFGESVVAIEDNAFYGCSGLKSLLLPNSLTTIGSNAFYGCRGLITITIPNSVRTMKSKTFYNCI